MAKYVTRNEVPDDDFPVVTRCRQHVGRTLGDGQDVLLVAVALETHSMKMLVHIIGFIKILILLKNRIVSCTYNLRLAYRNFVVKVNVKVIKKMFPKISDFI